MREFEAARAAGEIDDGLNLREEAIAARVFSGGLGQRALVHPELLTPAVQQRLVAKYLSRLRTQNTRGVSPTSIGNRQF